MRILADWILDNWKFTPYMNEILSKNNTQIKKLKFTYVIK
jgi:hypothetical protein